METVDESDVSESKINKTPTETEGCKTFEAQPKESEVITDSDTPEDILDNNSFIVISEYGGLKNVSAPTETEGCKTFEAQPKESEFITDSNTPEDILDNSFIVISECGEEDESQNTSDDFQDLGFSIDTKPIEEKKFSSNVPLFKRARKNILKEEQITKENNDAIRNKIKNTCFNCDGDHALRDCELPRNMKKINKARKLRNSKAERYHVDVEQRFAHVKPGIISEKLSNALGLQKTEIPPMFYKMRVLKYPPAWLEEAKIAHSGITLFGSKGYTILGSDDDEGELAESKLKYDLSKIINFPGFNTHPGAGYFDDYKYQGTLPFSSKDSKERFIKSFKFNAAEQGYKRKKLKFDAEQNDDFEFTEEMNVTDMIIDEDDICKSDQNLQLPAFLLNQPPPPAENPPSAPPPPPEDSEEGECGLAEVSNDNRKIKKLPTEDGDFQDLSLDDLEVKQAELLKLLKTSEEKSENSNLEPQNINEQSSTENFNVQLIAVEDTAIVNQDVESSKNVLSNIIIPSNENTIEKQDEIMNNKNKNSILMSSTFGTPILKFTPYDKLPSGDLFKEGVSDVINFENLPDSTGKYDQMKKLLYKVRKRISEIYEIND